MQRVFQDPIGTSPHHVKSLPSTLSLTPLPPNKNNWNAPHTQSAGIAHTTIFTSKRKQSNNNNNNNNNSNTLGHSNTHSVSQSDQATRHKPHIQQLPASPPTHLHLQAHTPPRTPTIHFGDSSRTARASNSKYNTIGAKTRGLKGLFGMGSSSSTAPTLESQSMDIFKVTSGHEGPSPGSVRSMALRPTASNGIVRDTRGLRGRNSMVGMTTVRLEGESVLQQKSMGNDGSDMHARRNYSTENYSNRKDSPNSCAKQNSSKKGSISSNNSYHSHHSGSLDLGHPQARTSSSAPVRPPARAPKLNKLHLRDQRPQSMHTNTPTHTHPHTPTHSTTPNTPTQRRTCTHHLRRSISAESGTAHAAIINASRIQSLNALEQLPRPHTHTTAQAQTHTTAHAQPPSAETQAKAQRKQDIDPNTDSLDMLLQPFTEVHTDAPMQHEVHVLSPSTPSLGNRTQTTAHTTTTTHAQAQAQAQSKTHAQQHHPDRSHTDGTRDTHPSHATTATTPVATTTTGTNTHSRSTGSDVPHSARDAEIMAVVSDVNRDNRTRAQTVAAGDGSNRHSPQDSTRTRTQTYPQVTPLNTLPMALYEIRMSIAEENEGADIPHNTQADSPHDSPNISVTSVHDSDAHDSTSSVYVSTYNSTSTVGDSTHNSTSSIQGHSDDARGRQGSPEPLKRANTHTPTTTTTTTQEHKQHRSQMDVSGANSPTDSINTQESPTPSASLVYSSAHTSGGSTDSSSVLRAVSSETATGSQLRILDESSHLLVPTRRSHTAPAPSTSAENKTATTRTPTYTCKHGQQQSLPRAQANTTRSAEETESAQESTTGVATVTATASPAQPLLLTNQPMNSPNNGTPHTSNLSMTDDNLRSALRGPDDPRSRSGSVSTYAESVDMQGLANSPQRTHSVHVYGLENSPSQTQSMIEPRTTHAQHTDEQRQSGLTSPQSQPVISAHTHAHKTLSHPAKITHKPSSDNSADNVPEILEFGPDGQSDFEDSETENQTLSMKELDRVLHKVDSTTRGDIADSLMRFYLSEGYHVEFLCKIGDLEILYTAKPTTLFRGASLFTKAMDYFMYFVGMPYIHVTLSAVINTICEPAFPTIDVSQSSDQTTASLERSYKRMAFLLRHIIVAISSSLPNLPIEFRFVFAHLRDSAATKFGFTEQNDLTRPVSATLILRFFSLAIVSPHLSQFQLVEATPSSNALKLLALLGKMLQKLANAGQFGDNEPYMVEMNKRIGVEYRQMFSDFMDQVSLPLTDEELERGHFYTFEMDKARILCRLHRFMSNVYLDGHTEHVIVKLLRSVKKNDNEDNISMSSQVSRDSTRPLSDLISDTEHQASSTENITTTQAHSTPSNSQYNYSQNINDSNLYDSKNINGCSVRVSEPTPQSASQQQMRDGPSANNAAEDTQTPICAECEAERLAALRDSTTTTSTHTPMDEITSTHTPIDDDTRPNIRVDGDTNTHTPVDDDAKSHTPIDGDGSTCKSVDDGTEKTDTPVTEINPAQTENVITNTNASMSTEEGRCKDADENDSSPHAGEFGADRTEDYPDTTAQTDNSARKASCGVGSNPLNK